MSFLISNEWTSYDEWEGEAVSDRFFNDEGSINENNDERDPRWFQLMLMQHLEVAEWRWMLPSFDEERK